MKPKDIYFIIDSERVLKTGAKPEGVSEKMYKVANSLERIVAFDLPLNFLINEAERMITAYVPVADLLPSCRPEVVDSVLGSLSCVCFWRENTDVSDIEDVVSAQILDYFKRCRPLWEKMKEKKRRELELVQTELKLFSRLST